MKFIYLSMSILLLFINSSCSQNQLSKVIVISVQNEANNNYSIQVLDGQAKFTNGSNLTLLDPKSSNYNCYIKGTRCDIKSSNQLNLVNPNNIIVIVKSIPFNMGTINVYNPKEKITYTGNPLSQNCFATYRKAQESGRWEDESVSGLAMECTLIRIAEEIGNNIWGTGQWFLENLFVNNNSIVSKKGLIAYYPFNGNSNDESGNGNNGTPNGSVNLTYDRLGNADKAFNFSGGNITVSTTGFHNPSFTISCWIKPVASTCYYDGPVIYSDYDGYYNGNTLTLRKNGTVDIGLSGGSEAKSYQSRSINVVPLNQWSFITASYNGSILKVYINGILDNTLSAPYFTYSTKTLLKIGDASWSGDYHFNGIIDELRIYNRALTDSEIQLLKNE